MKLESLPKTIDRRKKRIGRGPGSGKGKTGGRGTKGQNARGKLPIGHPHFEGGQRSLFKRLPYKRGKDNPKISKKPLIVNLEALNVLSKGQTVNLESLIKFGIVKSDDAKHYGVKILGGGSLNIPLVIQLAASKSAIEKIKKAGGKVGQ
jgi:large subunit ribosomal protein L15